MGVATCLVWLALALLGLYLKIAATTFGPGRDPILTVHITLEETEPKPAPAAADQEADLLPADAVPIANDTETPPRLSPDKTPRPPPDERAAIDWHRAITETVAAIGNEKQRQEELRSSMWRQTHSIMFQPSSAAVLREPEPILPDFRFKPELHVAGLGMTIGSCFIGLPLVGIPVEERTVAITLFTCAKD